ncbi:MAG: aminoglycoside phosphotransferase family protein [Eudoraea sp.]|nr:aminoglycoside phosphotransferase family protein [Eudoraea sp.]
MDSKLAEMALEHFVIERKRYDVSPIVQGYINNTFKIVDNGIPKYLLQHLNRDVFQDIPGLMQNLQAILPLLNQKGYSSIDLTPTKARTPFYKDMDGEYWRLMTYIPESISYNTTKDLNVAYESGRILGVFHRLLKDLPETALLETIPGFHDLDKRVNEFQKAKKNASLDRSEKAKKWILFTETTLSKINANLPRELPIRICHNDTKLNNFLFSKKTGKALCLIDLDTVMPGYFHFDFGDAIRTIVNPNPEDQKELGEISFDLKMAEAFLHGLKESDLELTATEKKALPYGAVLMPFLHGLRALTDYLNNDIYYQVRYPEQNLDRSKSLFTVAQKTMDHKEELANSVSEILGS